MAPNSKIRAAVFGATGYTGKELVQLLLQHPDVDICFLASGASKKEPMSDYYREFYKFALTCEPPSIEKALKTKPDVVFLALPHGISMEYAPGFLKKGVRVIDLSADFRIKDKKLYEQVYARLHTADQYLKNAVYGLPEFFTSDIKNAQLIANPGCYPTSVILALAPVLDLIEAERVKNIIVDSKTGLSGAGRHAKLPFLYSEVTDSIYPYKIGVHQHVPEMEQVLSSIARYNKVELYFTPHCVPMDRGILSTIYLVGAKDPKGFHKRLFDFYRDSIFIRVRDKLGDYPSTKHVVNTNFCDIAVAPCARRDVVVITSVIDNLVKGASGQAVQNMNIMFGLDENKGILKWTLKEE